jgi:2-phospho-L-lactate transferase/gluconeogenesis factor (CofD/UPF0052 family)
MITIFVYVKNLTETYECGADSVDSAIELSQQRHTEISIVPIYEQGVRTYIAESDTPVLHEGEYWIDVVGSEIEHYLS